MGTARGRRGLGVVLPVLLLLAGAAQAQAAQRYASPGGSGTECTSGNPCTLEEAVGFAGTADEVIVNPGTYNVIGSNFLTVTGAMNVHGAAGQPAPQINFTS